MPEDAPVSVSVVVPACNAERTIGEAVESVLHQADVPFELIVVDDGSTDRTLEIVSSLADPRLLVLSGPNRGVSAARNRGIARARGEIVAFLDADDAWLPGTLRAQIEAFRRMPAADAVYCWVDHVDVDGRYICPDRRVTAEGDVHRLMLVHNFIHTVSAVAIRKSILDEIGGFDESLPVLEDWDLYLRLAARARFACVRQALVRYRRSPGSLTSRLLELEATYRRVSERAFASAPAALAHLKARNLALFYEYLTTKATQADPSRASGGLALRFFASAVRHRPLNVVSLWQRPWVLRSLVRAVVWIVTGRAGSDGVSEHHAP